MIIVLDMGSGETCKNDPYHVRAMIDAVDDADNREVEIILKWQLFRGGEFAHLRALHPGVFALAYDYARSKGYATTASVFDAESLDFLTGFRIPFVKYACLPSDQLPLGWDAGYWEYPRVMSYGNTEHENEIKIHSPTPHRLACVREYPAKSDDYVDRFSYEQLTRGISDHTDHSLGMMMYGYKPELYETHFCLDWQDGPDTGPFALRPEQLRDMLEAL
jgi:sialic acid synthase SpsE